MGEAPNTQALRSAFGQVEPMQRCGISTRSVGIMRAAGCDPLKREPGVAVSERQNLKRASKSLILLLKLTQRADFSLKLIQRSRV